MCVCVCVCVCVLHFCSGAHRVETRIICMYFCIMYVYIYYIAVLVPGDPLRSYRGHVN